MHSTPRIAEKIKVGAPAEGVALLSFRASVKDIVTLGGSFLGGKRFNPPDNPMVAPLTVAMLDEGTRRHSRDAIRKALSRRGATIDFACGGERVYFTARCLAEHLGEVVEFLAEQVREPRFGAKEFAAAKRRETGKHKLEHEDTRARAEQSLVAALYPQGHPNFEPPADKKIAALERTSRANLAALHRRFGRGSLIVTAAGAVSHEELAAHLARRFGDWKKTALAPAASAERDRRLSRTLRVNVPVADKASVDLMVGEYAGITREHPDFYALFLGLQVLGGGGFTGRLMQRVRDQQGLTYGVYAGLDGFSDGADGYWYVWGTFAPALRARGEEAVRRELREFSRHGITAGELAMKKESLAGQYLVSLGTTAALAATMLKNAEEGRAPDFLDEYPDILRRLTLEEVNTAIRRYVHPERATIVAAGAVY